MPADLLWCVQESATATVSDDETAARQRKRDTDTARETCDERFLLDSTFNNAKRCDPETLHQSSVVADCRRVREREAFSRIRHQVALSSSGDWLDCMQEHEDAFACLLVLRDCACDCMKLHTRTDALASLVS